jgi:threonine aldolase
MRYVAAQFIPFLQDHLWHDCAIHANRLAARLRDALQALPDVQFTQPVESNQLFFVMPKEKEGKLHEKFYFYYWNEPIGEMRLVTSWDTTEEDVDELIAYLRSL